MNIFVTTDVTQSNFDIFRCIFDDVKSVLQIRVCTENWVIIIFIRTINSSLIRRDRGNVFILDFTRCVGFFFYSSDFDMNTKLSASEDGSFNTFDTVDTRASEFKLFH